MIKDEEEIEEEKDEGVEADYDGVLHTDVSIYIVVSRVFYRFYIWHTEWCMQVHAVKTWAKIFVI